MATHNELGIKGEALAVIYLKKKGYQILATNWRWQKAEVDIIVSLENTLIFVEVKTRSSDAIIKPEEAVHNKKQKMLIDAAEAYCELNQLDYEIRFDIIAIIHNGKSHLVKHIENAF